MYLSFILPLVESFDKLILMAVKLSDWNHVQQLIRLNILCFFYIFLTAVAYVDYLSIISKDLNQKGVTEQVRRFKICRVYLLARR